MLIRQYSLSKSLFSIRKLRTKKLLPPTVVAPASQQRNQRQVAELFKQNCKHFLTFYVGSLTAATAWRGDDVLCC